MTKVAELGRATTYGQAQPLGVDDPVVAARAVRRALAAAGRRAFDVTDLVVAANEPVPSDVLARFARRALGPHGSTVRAIGLVESTSDASGLAELALAAAASNEAPDGLVIAVGMTHDGTTEARCLGAISPGQGAISPG
jgi:hypothetical protein